MDWASKVGYLFDVKLQQVRNSKFHYHHHYYVRIPLRTIYLPGRFLFPSESAFLSGLGCKKMPYFFLPFLRTFRPLPDEAKKVY